MPSYVAGALRNAAAAAALFLLLPLIGPLADHHFVERLPGHSHLLLGAQQSYHPHTHFGSRPHAHPRPVASPAGPPNPFAPAHEPGAQGQGDVLSFAPMDGWTPPAYGAPPLSLLVGAVFLLGIAAPPIWGMSAPSIFARSADLPPPKRPPRRSPLLFVILM